MLYWIAKAVFAAIFWLVYRAEVVGAAHVPETGPVILVSNHIAWWDPPFVGVASPRRVHFMAKAELFEYPVFGTLLRMVGAYPVRRGQPDRAALRTTYAHLDAGRVVAIFAEGTRSKSGVMKAFEPGAALVALKSRAPVVPVAIRGPYRPLRGVTLTFGRPLAFPEHYGEKPSPERLEAITARVSAAVAELLSGGGPASAMARQP